MGTDTVNNPTIIPLVISCTSGKVPFAADKTEIVVKIIVVVVNIVTSVLGTLANGIVMTAYYRNRRLKTIQNTIFLLLAATDISIYNCCRATNLCGRYFERFDGKKRLSGLGNRHSVIMVVSWFINGDNQHSQLAKLYNIGLSIQISSYNYQTSLKNRCCLNLVSYDGSSAEINFTALYVFCIIPRCWCDFPDDDFSIFYVGFAKTHIFKWLL